jgi:hypothetical protein
MSELLLADMMWYRNKVCDMCLVRSRKETQQAYTMLLPPAVQGFLDMSSHPDFDDLDDLEGYQADTR